MTPDHILITGRILLALYFVGSGVRHFWVFPAVRDMMAKRGVPMASVALVCGTAVDILGGLAIAAGFYVVAAAIVLIVFTLVASFIAFDFWNQDEPQRSGSINGGLANLAVIGGLLVLIAGQS